MKGIKRLFDYASDFIGRMSVWDVGLLKICLLALGVLIGTALPGKYKKNVLLAASIGFGATYVPLMTKFLRDVCRQK